MSERGYIIQNCFGVRLMKALKGFLSLAYEYGHSDLSDNLDYGIMLKIRFCQNECGESIDDRSVRQKKV